MLPLLCRDLSTGSKDPKHFRSTPLVSQPQGQNHVIFLPMDLMTSQSGKGFLVLLKARIHLVYMTNQCNLSDIVPITLKGLHSLQTLVHQNLYLLYKIGAREASFCHCFPIIIIYNYML